MIGRSENLLWGGLAALEGGTRLQCTITLHDTIQSGIVQNER